MALAATATVVAVASVRVDVTGVPASGITGWQVVAHAPGGDYTVRGAPAVTGTTATLTDYYPPLSRGAVSRPITYTVRCFTASGTLSADTAAVTVPGPTDGRALLTDSEHPSSTLTVTVREQTPWHWSPRSLFYDVLDRADSVVAVQPARMRDGDVTFLTDTISERTALREMLRGGAPLLLRSTNPTRVDDVMMLPTDFGAEERTDLDEGRLWTVTYQATSSDLGPYPTPAGRDYGTLLSDGRVPTYADLAGNLTYRTYQQVLDGVP